MACIGLTYLRLRPHTGPVALPVLRAAHTDVQFCTADTNCVIKMQSKNDTQQANCVLLQINERVTVMWKWLSGWHNS
jgi:hypothetical protein